MRRNDFQEGGTWVICGQDLALPRAPEVTSEVAAKMTEFKPEMTWVLKGFVSSLKKHFALPKLGLTHPHY